MTDMLQSSWNPPDPASLDVETTAVLKALAAANRMLGELKGRAASIPNQEILLRTLFLQESMASSAIENIVTTQDELYRARSFPERRQSAAAKEVDRYYLALVESQHMLKATQGLITNNVLINLYRLLTTRSDGFRDTPGTKLIRDRSREIIYIPPQDGNEIMRQMTKLEHFINDDTASSLDPLIKMALIHHQFESIHPFRDGNGRVGRILNVLYLTRTGLLDMPILYLSRHIIRTREEYYRRLQAVRDTDGAPAAWEDWVLYMLVAVAATAAHTLTLVDGIRRQMAGVKARMRQELPRLYSQDLLNNLFRHPYTRIDLVTAELGVSRQTAARYLDLLAARDFVEKHRLGRHNYYINHALTRLLSGAVP